MAENDGDDDPFFNNEVINVAAVQNVAEVANAGVGSNAPAVGAGKKNNRTGTTNWNSEDHDAILNSISNMGGNWEKKYLHTYSLISYTYFLIYCN
jgi:hypothetical protein